MTTALDALNVRIDASGLDYDRVTRMRNAVKLLEIELGSAFELAALGDSEAAARFIGKMVGYTDAEIDTAIDDARQLVREEQ